MYPTNAPASLLAGNPDVRYLVLIRQIWHRSRAAIARRAQSIPQDIAEIIVACLVHDKHSLIACSLTCRSLYIASTPHLHHTLVLENVKRGRLSWPKPLQEASKLGLLPLVKKLWLRRAFANSQGLHFPEKLFNHEVLCQISGLTNVRVLAIDDLNIPAFMPEIQRYFGHFLPRLPSLSLREARGSNREIIFFIGLFQRLEDLVLQGTPIDFRTDQPFNDPTLIPPSTPPLRGRLIVANFYRPHFSEEMIKLFGRIRFRHVVLSYAGEPQLLLNACAKTLETVNLRPTESGCSEQLQSERVRLLANNFTDWENLIFESDLSKNKALRTLQLEASSLDPYPGSRLQTRSILTFLKTVLSTITSPTFSEVSLVYCGHNWTKPGCIGFHPYSKPNY